MSEKLIQPHGLIHTVVGVIYHNNTRAATLELPHWFPMSNMNMTITTAPRPTFRLANEATTTSPHLKHEHDGHHQLQRKVLSRRPVPFAVGWKHQEHALLHNSRRSGGYEAKVARVTQQQVVNRDDNDAPKIVPRSKTMKKGRGLISPASNHLARWKTPTLLAPSLSPDASNTSQSKTASISRSYHNQAHFSRQRHTKRKSTDLSCCWCHAACDEIFHRRRTLGRILQVFCSPAA